MTGWRVEGKRAVAYSRVEEPGEGIGWWAEVEVIVEVVELEFYNYYGPHEFFIENLGNQKI